MNEIGNCTFCKREMELTFHHLIPRTCHKNKWFKDNFTFEDMKTRGVLLCKDCHITVHQTIPNEKELGRYYNTIETLLEQQDIKRFVNWVTSRPNRRYR